MKIIYFSLTGNCEKFLKFAKIPQEEIVFLDDVLDIDYEYVLLTPTIGFGEVPLQVDNFLKKYSNLARGVVASGNRNWGQNYAVAADVIHQKYGIPILMKFELLGTKSDIEKFREIYEELKNYA